MWYPAAGTAVPYLRNCGTNLLERRCNSGRILHPTRNGDFSPTLTLRTKRPGLGNKSPYELLLEDENNEDFMLLWQLLKMDLIPPDEVHLMPDLFKFKL